MFYFKKKDYQDARQQLYDEYAISFQKAETYIRCVGYGLAHQEFCMMQVLDDFLCAQKEKKPLSKITGPDLRLFCDNIIKAELDRITNRKLLILEYIALYLLLCMMCTLQDAIIPGDNIASSFQHLQLNCFALTFPIMLIFGLHLKRFMARIFFEDIKKMKNSTFIINLSSFGLSYILAMCLRNILPIAIPVHFTVVVILCLISIVIMIYCIKEEKKNIISIK